MDNAIIRLLKAVEPIGRQMMRNRAAAAGAFVLLLVVLGAIFAPVVAPYDPLEIDPSNTLQAPSADHWFGTDDAGRDVLSRVIWGARISLRVGLISAGIATLVGSLLGLISGYYGGVRGFLILRLFDLLLAFPITLLALVIVTILGTGIDKVMIAVGFAAIPTFGRVVHGCVLSVKENDYVEAARTIGCRDLRIIICHIAPNILAVVIVLSTLQIASAIFAASGLSYVGLGAQPPTPEWGSMVSRGRYNLSNAAWMSAFPGFAIALVIIAINVVGDGLREGLDPWMRER